MYNTVQTSLEVAMARAVNLDVIPEMTDPMGKYWDQPSRRLIEVDTTHALMSQRTFEQLCNYSGSIPSGVYVGKMWRRHDGLFDSRCPVEERRWMLCWYGPDKDPKLCSIHRRLILIV